MKNRYLLSILIFILIILASGHSFSAQIILKKSFIEEFKDKVLIEANFTIDAAPDRPHSISSGGDDGDMHVSGRAPEIGLATVAEIKNAREHDDAVNFVQENVGNTVEITGVYRIWNEHGGPATAKHIQGEELQPFTGNTNPDHVFEIHPITQIDDISLLDSLSPIEGYTPFDVATAFPVYGNKKCTITPGADTVTIDTPKVTHNHVAFKMQLVDDNQFPVPGGRMVYASILKMNGTKAVIEKRRMVFVEGSKAELIMKNAHKGGTLKVMGIPRINLRLVQWRIDNANRPDKPLTWKIPYEMIIVAVLD